MKCQTKIKQDPKEKDQIQEEERETVKGAMI